MACSGAIAPQGVTAVEIAADSPAAASGVQPGDILLAVNGAPVESPADVVEYQHRGTRWNAAVIHAASSRQPRSARGLARAKRPGPRRCTSCWRRSACSRCSSAHRCVCGARAIRRRCISSGCAWRSSAPSRSRSTVRSIGWTGRSTGATRWRWRCCRRCCCTSRWCFRSGRRWRGRRPAPDLCCCRPCTCRRWSWAPAESSRSRAAAERRAVVAHARRARSRSSRSTCSSAPLRRSSC